MRLWSLHPRYLDSKGLVALWREALLAQAVLASQAVEQLLLIDIDNPEEVKAAEGISHRLARRAMRFDGTCTGEHGIGLHKMGFLLDEAGAGAVNMMRTIKQALDPHNIMNPGKIFSL